MQVRRFEPKDEERVKQLILSILTREYPFDKSVYENSDLVDIGQVYEGRRDGFYVLEAEGKIVGTVGVKEDSEDTALIRRLFVDPTCRRKGYGELLLGKAILHCRQLKFKHIVSRTTGRMAQAINLLKKIHFQEAEKIDLGGFQIFKFILDLKDNR